VYCRKKSTRTCPVSQEWLHQGNVRGTARVIQLGKRDKQTEFWKGSLLDGDNMEGQHEHRAQMITLTSQSIDI
jgi:hypothetical protein